MKAVAIKGVREFEIKEVNEPITSEKDVVIKVEKTGICGSDIHYWENGGPAGLIMGHEFSGTVVNPGSRTDLQVGDRVTALPISPCLECDSCETGNVQYCKDTWTHAVGLSLDYPGGLAPMLKVRKDMVYKIPEEMTFEEGAMVEPTAVGLHAIHLADIKVGSKVLVIGGGIIGLVSAMFAKKEGAQLVVLTETNSERGKKSVSLGVADEWYDAKEENTIPTLLEKTEDGFDVVIECVGNAPAVNSALTLVKPGGTVVLVGVSTTDISIYTVMAVMKELTVLGAIGYTKDEFKTCIDLIANKNIDVKPFIDDIVGLENVQKSYERLTSGTDSAVKILVDPNK